jgi:superoxide dismutase, Cu-Zn family
MKNLICTSIITLALCVACASKETTQPAPAPMPAPTPEPGPTSAQATMKPAKKQKTKGIVHFTQSDGVVKVEAIIEGLKPGPHGFHIHETGDCSAEDFSSAGGHFNPGHKAHGGPEAAEKHAGDMGNIIADNKGNAKLNIELNGMSLSGPESIVGKAVIIHEKADDMKTPPTGNAGARLACGVIEALK